MKRFRTVFLGTPEFAVPALEALAKNTEVVLVISQPDRPTGRGRKMTPPPVKVSAEHLGIEVIQPQIVKGRKFAAEIERLEPDFIVTAAFGRVLGPSLLSVPKLDALNVHASLLPLYRGAAPINRAILNGDQYTGVSIMRMVTGLDEGPVFHVAKTPIGIQETAGQLTQRLAKLGAEALMEAIERFDELDPVEQNHEQASWAPILSKRDGILDWTRTSTQLGCQVRGMHPWPCAQTKLRGEPLKIHSAQILDSSSSETAGKIIDVSADGIDVACGKGVLRLTEVQAAGKKRLPVSQFLTGIEIVPGTVLE